MIRKFHVNPTIITVCQGDTFHVNTLHSKTSNMYYENNQFFLIKGEGMLCIIIKFQLV